MDDLARPELKMLTMPEYSEWACYMFGNDVLGPGLVWRPAKGKHPNWFWRKMQYLVFGNRWVKS